MKTAKFNGNTWAYWFDGHPDDDRKVLCLTRTKKFQYNMVIGYWDPEAMRWCCGMNSNVIAWMPLPDVPEA